MRWLILFAVIFVFSLNRTYSQEVTAEPPAPTAPSPIVVTTIDPDGDGSGQLVLVDYSVTAGESILAVLLVLILFSVWGIFVFLTIRERPRRG